MGEPDPLTADGIVIDDLGRRWDPAKHPRGRNGWFIEVGGLVKLFTTHGPNTEDERQVIGLGVVKKINNLNDVEVKVTTGPRAGERIKVTPREIAVVPPNEVRLDRGQRFLDREDGGDRPDYREDQPLLTREGEKLDSAGNRVPHGFSRDLSDEVNERYKTDDDEYSVIVTRPEGGRPRYDVFRGDNRVFDASHWGENENDIGSVLAVIGGDRAHRVNQAQIAREALQPWRGQLVEALQRRGYSPETIVVVQRDSSDQNVADAIQADLAHARYQTENVRIANQDLPQGRDWQIRDDNDKITNAIKHGVRGAPEVAPKPVARLTPPASAPVDAPSVPNVSNAPNALNPDLARPRDPANEGFEDLNVPVVQQLIAMLPLRQRGDGPGFRDERNARYALQRDAMNTEMAPFDRRTAVLRAQFLLRRANRANPEEFGRYIPLADRLIAPRDENARVDAPEVRLDVPQARIAVAPIEERQASPAIRVRGAEGFPDSGGEMLHVGDRVRGADGIEGTIVRFDQRSQRAVIRTPNGDVARKANRITPIPNADAKADAKARTDAKADVNAPLGPESIPDVLRTINADMVQKNKVPGFKSDSLDDANVNDTYLLTESATGRKFIYKRTTYHAHGGEDTQAQAEVDAAALLRGSGYQGAAYVEQVGSGAVITTWVGEQNNRGNTQNQVKIGSIHGDLNLKDPKNAIQLQIFDILFNNNDRHGNNLIVAWFGTDQSRSQGAYLLPFDHGGGGRDLDRDVTNDVFKRAMSDYIGPIAQELGQDATTAEIRRYALALKAAAQSMNFANTGNKQKIIDRAQRIFDSAEDISRMWLSYRVRQPW